MRKKFIRNKKARYAAVSVALTVMVIVVAVLANAVLTSLVERYSLYAYLTPVEAFDVSEDCYSLLENAFEDAKAPTVEILFCDLEDNVKADDSPNYYLYHTAMSLAERFDNVKVKFLDIFTNPTPVKPYTTSTNPLTGEVIETAIISTSVIVVSGEYHRVYNWMEFYVFEDETSGEPWAYNGEKKLSAALMRAIDTDPRIACLLSNHGEVFYDYELLTLLDDAGYTVVYIDLYKESIPDNCDMIISYNPNSDLITDDLSKVSEKEILDEFLKEDGHSFFVFLENGTPSLPNFEAYLKEWGVATDYAKNATTEVSYRYMVQDQSQSLTSYGYTIYGEATQSEAAKDFLNPDAKYVVFSNATALSVTSEGYTDQHDGTYRSMSGARTLYPLYYSGNSALSWANGKVVDDGPFMLMSVTEQNNGNGSSYVGVVSSVNFSAKEFLQSAVYDNGDVMFRLLDVVGERSTPAGLTIKPFASYDISTITTAQMLRWTVALAAIPAVVTLAVGVIVLVKRRRA